MDFRLLGPLEVFDGSARLAIAAGKQRALLAMLLLHSNRTVGREQIVDALWGEGVPESALKMVQIHVSQLRKALPEPRLHTRPPGYLLEVAEHPLREHVRSQHMLALYRSGRQAEALASYQAFRRTLADDLGMEPSASL